MEQKQTLKGDILTVMSGSDRETIDLGKRLGASLREGDVVALIGELGTGKTWLTKGIALGLEVPSDTVITSPSFSLVNEYDGKLTLYHMDVYRLGTLSEFMAAGLEEYLYAGGVAVMEWADRWPEILPPQTLRVEIGLIDERGRRIELSGRHPRAVEIITNLTQWIDRG